MDAKLLTTYLNDHLAGATGGLELFRRATDTHQGSPLGDELAQLTTEVAEDREALIGIMATLHIRRNWLWASAGGIAEKLGRLKPNGFILRRSPLSDVVELEALRIGVWGKLSGWEVLLAGATDEPALDRVSLETLLERAHDQLERLRKMHVRVARDRLSEAP